MNGRAAGWWFWDKQNLIGMKKPYLLGEFIMEAECIQGVFSSPRDSMEVGMIHPLEVLI